MNEIDTVVNEMNAKQRRIENRKFKFRVKLKSQSFSGRGKIMAWLKDNGIKEWRSPETNVWNFSNAQDATFFTLRWLSE